MRAYPERWMKAVRHRMIDEDMGMKELAEKVGKSRGYVSSVINGRVVNDSIVAAICNILDVPDPETMKEGQTQVDAFPAMAGEEVRT